MPIELSSTQLNIRQSAVNFTYSLGTRLLRSFHSSFFAPLRLRFVLSSPSLWINLKVWLPAEIWVRQTMDHPSCSAYLRNCQDLADKTYYRGTFCDRCALATCHAIVSSDRLRPACSGSYLFARWSSTDQLPRKPYSLAFCPARSPAILTLQVVRKVIAFGIRCDEGYHPKSFSMNFRNQSCG